MQPSRQLPPRVTPLVQTEPNLDDTIAYSEEEEDKPCPTCGVHPHRVQAVRQLPPEMQHAFPLPDESKEPGKEVYQLTYVNKKLNLLSFTMQCM